MRRRLGATGAVMAATLVLIGVPSASAASEVGTDCAAEIAQLGTTVVPLTRSSQSPRPMAAPAAGVVTEWSLFWALSGSLAPIPQKLKVVRPTGALNEFQVVAESPVENILKGPNSFATRIPVQTGDRFGLYGPSGSTLFCNEAGAGETMGRAFDDLAPGSIATFTPEAEGNQVPVIAVVEPDEDGDGYGDETQDLCPQNPNGHACPQLPPTISLDAFPIVLKRSVLVLVSASAEASVDVIGQGDVGTRRVPRGARSSKKRAPRPPQPTRPIVGLTGGTQIVKPGEIGRFNVKLPKSLMRRLGRISPKESLKATITARTTDLAGRVSERTITARLPGQKRLDH